jgi:hypothetical protein
MVEQKLIIQPSEIRFFSRSTFNRNAEIWASNNNQWIRSGARKTHKRHRQLLVTVALSG